MNYWFLTYLVVSTIGLGIVFGKHGKPRPDYNGWASLTAFIIDMFFFVMAIRHGGF